MMMMIMMMVMVVVTTTTIFINCKWVDTWWQWSVYIRADYEA
jgi:hypothetical protein